MIRPATSSSSRHPSPQGGEATPRPDGLTAVIFDLYGQTMGVDVRNVREILARQTMSRLPSAPSEITGVIDLRGRCVPIIELSAILGMTPRDRDEEARIIVFELGSGNQVGVIAERVRDVVRIDAERIEPSPEIRDGYGAAPGVFGAARLESGLVFLLEIGHFLAGFCGAAEPAHHAA